MTLDDVEKKYEDLTKKISDPEIIAAQTEWKNYMKEHADLEPIVLKYREYKKVKQQLDEAKEMLKTEQDEYSIPLKTLYPNVTTNQIGNEAFPDMLSSFSTSYTSSA